MFMGANYSTGAVFHATPARRRVKTAGCQENYRIRGQHCAMISKQLQHKFQSARRSRSDVETDNANRIKQWTQST